MPPSKDTTSALTPDQGRTLLALARQTLSERFKRGAAISRKAELEKRLQNDALQARCGTFVTLKIGKQLRGCIGTLVSDESLVEGVRSNAINAAFNDPRFRPLSLQELDRISIEVSVLTEPQPLVYSDPEELIAKLRPRIDGVTIRKGMACATFLPQVWEQLPDPEAFLTQLCLKACMPADTWRKGDLEVETYQAQYFEESH